MGDIVPLLSTKARGHYDTSLQSFAPFYCYGYSCTGEGTRRNWRSCLETTGMRTTLLSTYLPCELGSKARKCGVSVHPFIINKKQASVVIRQRPTPLVSSHSRGRSRAAPAMVSTCRFKIGRIYRNILQCPIGKELSTSQSQTPRQNLTLSDVYASREDHLMFQRVVSSCSLEYKRG